LRRDNVDKEQAVKDLEYIRRLMAETRRVTLKASPLFLLWGAVAYTIAYFVCEHRNKPPLSTFSERVIGYSWIGCFVGLMVINYLAPFFALLNGHEYSYVLPLAATTVLLAGVLFVMGGMYELGSLRGLLWPSGLVRP